MAIEAKGSTGSWFATIGGNQIPCVHKHWVDGRTMTYHDPWIRLGRKQDDAFVDGVVRCRQVALCEDKVTERPGQPPDFERKGYIALFAICDATCDETGLRFRFAERLASLR